MLTVYIVSLVFGGALILLSIVGAGHGHEMDAHGGLDHGDVDHGGHDHGIELLQWMPFISMRFWTYFLAMFGGVGLALTLMTDTPRSMIPFVAAGTGLVSGLITFTIMRLAKKAEVHSGVSMDDTLGKEALVTVPIRPGSPGRIRCNVKGDIIDFLAVSDSPHALEVGSHVVVVSVDGAMLNVIPRDALFEDETQVVRA